MPQDVQLTILMPCLNEANTLENCIRSAFQALEKLGIPAEVLISDNGSTDNSVKVACDCGARVVHAHKQGYGSALVCGIGAAHGKYCLIADCDGSYDFAQIADFWKKLELGYDLVLGNRYLGESEKGAMPTLHHYIGTPLISLLGRKRYKNRFRDYNCGMRAFNVSKILLLNLAQPGMEFASEMIVKACQAGLKICEIPVNLYRDKRGGKPSHLRPLRDGLRHVLLLLGL